MSTKTNTNTRFTITEIKLYINNGLIADKTGKTRPVTENLEAYLSTKGYRRVTNRLLLIDYFLYRNVQDNELDWGEFDKMSGSPI